MIAEDEIRIISTDVIESLFEKYKSFSQKKPPQRNTENDLNPTDINIRNNERTHCSLVASY